MSRSRGIRRQPVRHVREGVSRKVPDDLAVEEPLEIRLGFEQDGRSVERSVSVTMRTPGHDRELAAGFLFSEGVVRRREDIRDIWHIVSSENGGGTSNIVRVRLTEGVQFDADHLKRYFYMASSCGVCGKTSIEALRASHPNPIPQGHPLVRGEVIQRLGKKMREGQTVFEQTGGLHAAALFDTEGTLIDLHEDVGRHNAVDKLIGEQCLAGELPVSESIMMISGRASFEIMQKASMAGISTVAAVSAPSSLAVDLAREFGMTLLGFVREERFNIYAGAERIMAHRIREISNIIQ